MTAFSKIGQPGACPTCGHVDPFRALETLGERLAAESPAPLPELQPTPGPTPRTDRYEAANGMEVSAANLCRQLERELDAALKLAYIGEHYFPDLTWKARCEELAAARSASGKCCCGEPTTLGVVHRLDGPCFHYESSLSTTGAIPTELPKSVYGAYYREKGYPGGDAYSVQRIWKFCAERLNAEIVSATGERQS